VNLANGITTVSFFLKIIQVSTSSQAVSRGHRHVFSKQSKGSPVNTFSLHAFLYPIPYLWTPYALPYPNKTPNGRKWLAGLWKPWTGTALVHFVVVVEDAPGSVIRHRSVLVVLWVEIWNRIFCERSSRAEKSPSHGTVRKRDVR
jgi:hypothetical protein